MAKNTAVRVLDDLTGEAAAETVGFGLDGIDYDIDLSFANAEALRGFLRRYADAGRRTGGRKNRPRLVPGAKLPRAKAKSTPKTAKPVAGRRAAAKKAEPAQTPKPAAKATTAKAAPAKATRAKTTAKAEPAKTTRARKVAEPKKSTPASTRKVPTVTFSAAE